jgi:hypothetical protein
MVKKIVAPWGYTRPLPKK